MKTWIVATLALALCGCNQWKQLSMGGGGTSSSVGTYSIPATGPVIFVGVGQSNARGSGQAGEFPNKPSVRIIDSEVSLGRRGPFYEAVSEFARVHVNNEVILIQCSRSGTPIRDFAKDTPLYTHCMDTIKQTEGTVIGVFFYQGESDAAPVITLNWNTSFERLICSIRHDLGSTTLPVIWAQIAGIGPFHPTSFRANWLQFQMNQTAVRLPQYAAMVITKDQPLADNDMHLGYEGCQAVGRKFFRAYEAMITN